MFFNLLLRKNVIISAPRVQSFFAALPHYLSSMDATNPISTLLREAREDRRLSVAELSRVTNIRPHVISAIDDGDFAELPSVYMRSFIKRYAKAVGINEQEIDYLLDTHLSTGQQRTSTSAAQRSAPVSAPRAEVKEKRSPSSPNKPYMNRNIAHLGTTPGRKRMYWILGSTSLIGIVAALYFLYFAPHKNPNSITPGSLPPTVVGEQDSGSTANNSKGGLFTYFNGGSNSGDSLVLEAVASDTVWISIILDGKQSEQLTMYPQNTKRWTAQEKFSLSVGNAGGLSLARNGTPLPPLGRKGETVRSIVIKKNEFLTSASPWKSQRDTTKRKPTVTPPKPTSLKPVSTPPATIPQQPKKTPTTTSPTITPSTQRQQTSAPNGSNAKLPAATHGNTSAKSPVGAGSSTHATSAPAPSNKQGNVQSTVKPTTSQQGIKTPAQTTAPKPATSTGQSIGTPKPALPKPVSTSGSGTSAKSPTTSTAPPKVKATTKESAEEKKKREERLRRAKQLELTPAPFR